MEKMDFPKGTKPREIFVYTCERIAEPLIPLGYKYRKSKNDIYKKDGIFPRLLIRKHKKVSKINVFKGRDHEICVTGGMGNAPSSKRRGLVRVSAWCLLAPKDLACHVCREPHITRGERCSLFTRSTEQ